jgi:hypothetical protein
VCVYVYICVCMYVCMYVCMCNMYVCIVVSVWVCIHVACGGRGRWISEFEGSLVYRVSSRTARATQRNSVSKTTTTKKILKKRSFLKSTFRDAGLGRKKRTHRLI